MLSAGLSHVPGIHLESSLIWKSRPCMQKEPWCACSELQNAAQRSAWVFWTGSCLHSANSYAMPSTKFEWTAPEAPPTPLLYCFRPCMSNFLSNS